MAEITTLNEQNFNDTISSADVPVLVDFWAPWCGPCKAIAPILEELAGELDGKVQISKVNVDENGTVAAEYNIRAIPTLLLFKGGELADQFVGMVGKDDLKTKLQAHT
ncbi:MAG TPA: thioredoxin [Opitutae bacterium]|nr:thioredoxin [Opitutaceae bacterium]HCR30209.1 thioredoxin [Opitutae bacterium]|tara:strand:+ start:1551 stop:1874 length:324 start_codon:yes stop_codon:yes gene_type:complete